MISENVHISLPTTTFNKEDIKNGTWLAILHAQRVPPHIGLIISGNYNSLTIKEHEMNIDSEILIKTIVRKKIKSVFVKIIPHPVFSLDYQLSIFQEYLKSFGFVKQNETTCLSPIKLFFNEFYAIPVNQNELLFDFMIHLNDNAYLEQASALNMKLENGITLPCYSLEELNEKIKIERQPYYTD